MALAPKRALFDVPSNSIMACLVDRGLPACIQALERWRDNLVDIGHRPQNAFAAKTFGIIVPQFHRFTAPSRSPRRNGGPGTGAVLKLALHLYRGIAAGVEYFPAEE